MNWLALVTMCVVLAGSIAVCDQAQPKNGKVAIEQISEALKAEGSKVADSSLEFHYAVNGHGCLLPEIAVLEIQNDRDKMWDVAVVLCNAHSSGEESFGIAYLRSDVDTFVDWRSEWLSFRSGQLATRLLDVNDDGRLEFCFVCVRFDQREEILSAYSAIGDRFVPVVAERVPECEVAFALPVDLNGLTIRSLGTFNSHCRMNKIYELPVEIVNSTGATINMKGRYLWLSGEFSAVGNPGRIEVDELAPLESTTTRIVFRFAQAPPRSTISFQWIHRK